MNVGEGIKKARKQAGLTQKELALKLGKGFSTVQKYELGIISPPMQQLNQIANILNVPLREVLGLKDSDGEYGLFDTRKETEAFAKEISSITRGEKLREHFEKLNEAGQIQAIESIELLTEIPRYKK